MAGKTEILLYQTEDGQSKVEVRLENETVWLTQAQMVELFQTTKQNISLHVRNIFQEGELEEDLTVKDYLTVQTEGNRQVQRTIRYYNLDVIISIGYRVKSHRGTQFRIWATQQLKEFLIKGFVLNDERLKETGYTNQYFDELLERIRDIRSSEKIFYAKIKDIYTTSIDYSPDSRQALLFFASVQNKMHWAIHGHTAAEMIYHRANSDNPNMGLTSWKNGPKGKIRKPDVSVAKNYLSHDELIELNLIVDQYLSFAELQARNRKPMYMADWEKKLHDFLTLNEKQILLDAGRISHQMAVELAEKEFDKFNKKQIESDNRLTIKSLEIELKKLGKKI
ncbi:MAG TPA: virulence RhuM family protein [Bacteroidales bacterium]|nr:virulence RhuM family protein [Bacteroidales bacterium]HNQ83413.1 virulence RhuM family protein [Bacteroidales bacterium]